MVRILKVILTGCFKLARFCADDTRLVTRPKEPTENGLQWAEDWIKEAETGIQKAEIGIQKAANGNPLLSVG